MKADVDIDAYCPSPHAESRYDTKALNSGKKSGTFKDFQGSVRTLPTPTKFAHTASTPLFLVISPDTTSNRGQMFVRPYGVNICETLTLRDRWADVDETWHIPRVPGHNF